MENNKRRERDLYKIQCYVSKEVYETVKQYCNKVGMTMSGFGAMQIGNAALAIDRTLEIMSSEIVRKINGEDK